MKKPDFKYTDNPVQKLSSMATALRNTCQLLPKARAKEAKSLRKKIAALDRYVIVMETMTIDQVTSQRDALIDKVAKINTPERKTQWCQNNVSFCNANTDAAVTGKFQDETGIKKMRQDIKFMNDILESLRV